MSTPPAKVEDAVVEVAWSIGDSRKSYAARERSERLFSIVEVPDPEINMSPVTSTSSANVRFPVVSRTFPWKSAWPVAVNVFSIDSPPTVKVLDALRASWTWSVSMVEEAWIVMPTVVVGRMESS